MCPWTVKSNLGVAVDIAVCADEAGRLRGRAGCIFFVACPFVVSVLQLCSSSYIEDGGYMYKLHAIQLSRNKNTQSS